MAVTDDEDISLFSDHGYDFNESLSAVVVTESEPIERSMPPPPLGGVYNSEHEMQKAINSLLRTPPLRFDSATPPSSMRLRLRRKHLVQARCTVNGPFHSKLRTTSSFRHQQGQNDEEIR